MRSLTHRFGSKETPRGLAGWAGTAGSQRSAQTSVFLPDPIEFRRPALSRGCAAIKLRHTYEGLLTFTTSTGFVWRKYRPFRTLAKSEEGYWINRQSCFASRARLKLLRSRNPKPPLSCGMHIFFQAIQWRPL